MIFDLLNDCCVNIFKSNDIFKSGSKSIIDIFYLALKRIDLCLNISFCGCKSILKIGNCICKLILSCAFAESNLKSCCQLLYCSKTSGVIFDLLNDCCVNIFKSNDIFKSGSKSIIDIFYLALKRIDLCLNISFCGCKSILKIGNCICKLILSCAFAESNLKSCCQLLYCSKTSGVIFDLLDKRCVNGFESNDIFKSRIESFVNLFYLILKGVDLILKISLCTFKCVLETGNCFCKLFLSCIVFKSNLKCCCQLLYCCETSGVIFDLLDKRCINGFESNNIFKSGSKSSVDLFYLILKRVNLILEISV